MSLHITFQPPAFNVDAPLAGGGRASEAVAAGASGSLTAADGEMAVVTNVGASALYFTHGTTPNSAATVSTPATSARYAIGAGVTMAVATKTGDKFAVASS